MLFLKVELYCGLRPSQFSSQQNNKIPLSTVTTIPLSTTTTTTTTTTTIPL